MNFYQAEANLSNMGPNYFDMDLDKVVGLAYWGMIDYLGESLGWPAKGWTQGVFDISLEPKPSAYFLKSFFKPDEPVVRIGIKDSENNQMWNDVQVGTKSYSSHWNRKDGSKLELITYTNADEVELKINGKSIGRKRNDRTNSKSRNRIAWNDVPYAKGHVEAIAYNDGVAKPVAVHRIETAGKAVKLAATPDNQTWAADGMDLQHIAIEAVDSKGRLFPGQQDRLTFEVDGPAEIVGVINGDNSSNELTVGNTRSLYNGKATVILRSTKEPGEVTLTVTPDSTIKPTKLKLSTK